MEKHKIKRLQIRNLTCFDNAEMNFSPGINVLIGENGTGKTHLLKTIFGIVAGLSSTHIERNGSDLTLNTTGYRLENTLRRIFKVDRIDKIISFGQEALNLSVNWLEKEFDFEIKKEEVNISNEIGLKDEVPVAYLPPNEMLSWFEGFIAAYEKRESYIDEAYYELAKSLALLPLKGNDKKAAESLTVNLLKNTGIDSIRLDSGRFMVKMRDRPALGAHLNAQGLNKIAQVIYLVLNGSINEHTILLWDEPEAGLNPKHVANLATFIKGLAKIGVQVFIATHDYLLTHQLSLSAEYPTIEEDALQMKFFSLYQDEKLNTLVEAGKTLAEIKNNPILDEYAALHDLELDLYKKSLKYNGV